MNRMMQLGVNLLGKDYVIGDIHGAYDELMYGLGRVEFNPDKDRLIAVGDLIDRGKQNMQCLELIHEPWFYTVIGNHEVMMADAIKNAKGISDIQGTNPLLFWVANGGAWWYNLGTDELDKLRNKYAPMIFDKLPIGIQLIAANGKYVGVVHAGLPRGWTWTETRKHLECINNIRDKIAQTCLWTRDRVHDTHCNTEVLGIDLLITGHTPTPEPLWRGNNVFIDQGVYTKELTPILIDELTEEI